MHYAKLGTKAHLPVGLLALVKSQILF